MCPLSSLSLSPCVRREYFYRYLYYYYYYTMISLSPLIKYSFESWTPGSTAIINEGYSGSTNNGVLQNSAIVIASDYAVGAHS